MIPSAFGAPRSPVLTPLPAAAPHRKENSPKFIPDPTPSPGPTPCPARLWGSQHSRMVWRDPKSHPVPPPTAPGCSQPCPAWPWALPGIIQGQPQLLWEFHPSQEFPIPNLPPIPALWQWEPFPVSCPSIPCPQSLSSSPGAPSGPGRALSSPWSFSSPGEHSQLSQAWSSSGTGGSLATPSPTS
ncbi:hypothetical protein RLOC_00006252, partial [Lonchura striata]